jgi:hypothetical protein
VIHFPCEQGVRRGKQLQRTLSAAFFVSAIETVSSLPHRRFDDRQRNTATRDDRLNAPGRSSVFESAGSSLLGHRLSTLDVGVLWLVHHDPIAQSDWIDALFRADSNGRNVNGIDEPWRGAIIDSDDREAAADTRIYAEDFHGTPSRSYLLA